MVQFNDPFSKVGPTYFRHGVRNPPAEPSKDFEGKTVIVTGCNTGVVGLDLNIIMS
jgi:hypothetical protein